MARIKLVLPTHKIGFFTIPIRISDINYGNHVGNDAYVSIIHEARMQWLKTNGYTEMDFAGTGLIMSDIAIEFKQESFYGDIIVVELYAGEIARVSFELYYLLSAQRNSNSYILAKAKTGMVCYDYTSKKTAPVPDKARQLLMS
jgi:acyl-CoA thioesterase FadM